ncbi:hypothetical protein FJZ27_04665 [Candidatus Peribacteria bacterium]|nr:hypothetical protein [Candidatus Peribacteria bacterium]
MLHTHLIVVIKGLPTLTESRRSELLAKVRSGALSSDERNEIQDAILESIAIFEDERDTARQLLAFT